MSVTWVILTMGDRPVELHRAVDSVFAQEGEACAILVFCNGADEAAVAHGLPASDRLDVVGVPDNLGVPGGRSAAVKMLGPDVDVVGFLDDDALLQSADVTSTANQLFERPEVGAIALRLVDENGATSRRHVPRVGSLSPAMSGSVVTFLGGANLMRRAAYDRAGGYWPDLWYGHEELDLAWRFADAGFLVHYAADLTVLHPRTDIARHSDGWLLTGRNRVMVARRNLPAPLLMVHTLGWLLLGVVRAPTTCRRGYVRGWRAGWSVAVQRRPIGWVTVLRLARRGRPPIL